MKLAIIGSRKFQPLNLVKYQFDLNMGAWISKPDELEIVSGGASGPDTEAFKIAKEYRFKYTPFLPEYGLHGTPAALFERNTKIVQYSDVVWAFWDGTIDKGGTRDVMLKALLYKKSLYTFYQEGGWNESHFINAATI